MASWRDKAKAAIQATSNEAKEKQPDISQVELKKLVNAAYPFGERKYTPYKIWLEELNKEFGEKPDFVAPLSIAEAQAILEKVIEAFLFHNLSVDPMTEESRLRLLADDLDKTKGWLNADKIPITPKDSRFLRRLEKRLNASEA